MDKISGRKRIRRLIFGFIKEREREREAVYENKLLYLFS